MKFFERKIVLVCLFFVALLMLSLPYLFRFSGGNHIFIGSEPHYHARMASFIAANGIPGTDALFDSPYLVSPYHLLLAGISLLIPVELASIVVPVALGLFSLLFFYLVLRGLKLSHLRAFFIVLVFVFSPFFASVFSLSTPLALVFFLLFFGFFLFQRKSCFFFLLSFIPFGLLAMCGIIHSIVLLLVLFVYCFSAKKKLLRFYFISAVVLFICLAFHLPYYLLTGSIGQLRNSGLIAEFGAVYGFSIFSLLLGGLGLFFVWGYKTRYYLAYFLMVCVFIASFFVRDLLVYANVVVCFFAGLAFYSLYLREWELSDLRNFALLVIFCCLLFSSISNSVVLGKLPPSDSFVECLEWINANSSGSSAVFAHQSDSFFVEFWAERKVLVNELYAPENLVADSGRIWHSSDLNEVKRFFSRKGISYILIHEGLFNGFLWNTKGRELDFLLTNPETFKSRYNNSYCEVWEFKGE